MRDQTEVSAAERHGLLLVRLLVLTRALALCLAISSLAMNWDAIRAPAVVAALLFLVMADNVLVCFRLRRGEADEGRHSDSSADRSQSLHDALEAP